MKEFFRLEYHKFVLVFPFHLTICETRIWIGRRYFAMLQWCNFY